MSMARSVVQATPVEHVRSYSRISQVLAIPNLIRSQIESFGWFKAEGLAEVYKEISPIQDYTGNKYGLEFVGPLFP